MHRRIVTALLAVSALARAEFLWIEQSLTGLECPSCLESIPRVLGRIRGVEKVEVDRERSVARIELKPENRVRLEAIRDAAKGTGFTPGEAKVRARAKASRTEDGWQLEILGLGQKYRAEGGLLRDGEVALVEAAAAPATDPRAQPVLRVTSVNRESRP